MSKTLTLFSIDGKQLAAVKVQETEDGVLYADHPTFYFEVEIALCVHREGGVDTDTIDDENDVPYIRWTIA